MKREQPVRVEEPLIALLLKCAAKKEHSLAQLANEMGVSYQRLTQYRRGEAHLSNARKETLKNIGIYLDIPVVWVMLLSGDLGSQELSWPGDAERGRIRRALELMQQDLWLGPLMPPELEHASLSIQQFVVLLYRQYNAGAANLDQAQWIDMIAQLKPPARGR